jgi:hypothetical protein
MVKNFFSSIGAVIFAMSILGALGIGNFYLYYGFDALKCLKASTP